MLIILALTPIAVKFFNSSEAISSSQTEDSENTIVVQNEQDTKFTLSSDRPNDSELTSGINSYSDNDKIAKTDAGTHEAIDKEKSKFSPNILQANDTKQVSSEVTRWEQNQPIFIDKEIVLQPQSNSTATESYVRPRPALPEPAKFKITPNQAEEIRQRAISNLLGQYRDNPKQAKQIEELMYRILKQPKLQHNFTKTEKDVKSRMKSKRLSIISPIQKNVQQTN